MLNIGSLDIPVYVKATQKAARGIVFRCLDKLEIGSLTIIESFNTDLESRSARFGQTEPGELTATIEVKHPAFYRRLLRGGSIAAGESYMDGWWDSPDLTRLMELISRNLGMLDRIETQSSRATRLIYRLKHWMKRNTLENSRRNIHAHYDIGNDLYQTFLDESMLYSSGVFEQHSDTLEQAQMNKMERLCQQLQLTANDHVVEIGTGWGSMAIYMAQTYGCRVTTTTISDEQYDYARQKVRQHGLDDRITLLKQDYRLLEGQFDKLVSIEMIEAVGKQFLNAYLQKCQSLLKPGGRMAIQAITIADQRYDYYSNHVDFIQAYIFPGGFLPSVTALVSAATAHSDLVLRDLFDIGTDYAQTLKEWHRRFNLAENQVRRLGYDERFIRMWRYYLSYCEGGFLARNISTVHMTFQRP